MSTTRSNRALVSLLAGACVLVAILACGPLSAGEGRCISAQIPESVILPDGSAQPAGSVLGICLTRQYTPVSGLHKTSVDGNPVGLFVSSSSRVSAENAVETRAPYFEFTRNADDRWILRAYTVEEGGRLQTYALNGTSVTSHWNLASNNEEEVTSEAEVMILLAASNY